MARAIIREEPHQARDNHNQQHAADDQGRDGHVHTSSRCAVVLRHLVAAGVVFLDAIGGARHGLGRNGVLERGQGIAKLIGSSLELVIGGIGLLLHALASSRAVCSAWFSSSDFVELFSSCSASAILAFSC